MVTHVDDLRPILTLLTPCRLISTGGLGGEEAIQSLKILWRLRMPSLHVVSFPTEGAVCCMLALESLYKYICILT